MKKTEDLVDATIELYFKTTLMIMIHLPMKLLKLYGTAQ
jgi:hypothetical protein